MSRSDPERLDVTVGIPTWNRARLLRKSIESVLAQSYPHFKLVISDNASEDETANVVGAFEDPRLVYLPLPRNIGRAANINRLIDLAETEFVVLLCDDDELHPDHLSLTVNALKRWPSAGLAHTGCVIADLADNILNPHVRLIDTKHTMLLESGEQFLERSMKSGWTVCFSSANYRRAALIGVGGVRPEDGTMDDFPMLMRIAPDWDFAYLNRPLALVRPHPGAESSFHGSFTPDGFRASDSVPDMLYERRRTFLSEAALPGNDARRFAGMAEKARRRDRLVYLSTRARTGDARIATFRALGQEIAQDPRLAFDPMTWRFLAAQLGGRRIGDRLRRGREHARRRRTSGLSAERWPEPAKQVQELARDVASDDCQA